VAAENVSQKSLVVRASKETLTREFDIHYVYIPRETGMIDILLYKKEKGKEKGLLEKFRSGCNFCQSQQHL
jgi:hypothetical protein